MPFCPKCGKEVSSGATFCFYCGELLPKVQPSSEAKPIPTSQPVPASPPKPMPEESPLPTSHRTRNVVIAIALIVIAAAVVIVAYALVSGFISASTILPNPQSTYAMNYFNYSFSPSGYITIVVNNAGNAPLTIGSIYIDGAAVTFTGGAQFGPGNTTTVVTTSGPITDSLSHQVRIVSTVGAAAVFPIVYSGSQPQPQGSLSVDSGGITASGITIYVRNTGTKTEVLTSAYVDNVLIASGSVAFTPSAIIAPNQVCTVVISGSWADGASHIVRIVASDGTPVAFSVHD